METVCLNVIKEFNAILVSMDSLKASAYNVRMDMKGLMRHVSLIHLTNVCRRMGKIPLNAPLVLRLTTSIPCITEQYVPNAHQMTSIALVVSQSLLRNAQNAPINFIYKNRTPHVLNAHLLT